MNYARQAHDSVRLASRDPTLPSGDSVLHVHVVFFGWVRAWRTPSQCDIVYLIGKDALGHQSSALGFAEDQARLPGFWAQPGERCDESSGLSALR